MLSALTEELPPAWREMPVQAAQVKDRQREMCPRVRVWNRWRPWPNFQINGIWGETLESELSEALEEMRLFILIVFSQLNVMHTVGVH